MESASREKYQSDHYDKEYFDSSCGAQYIRNSHWLNFFGNIAVQIKKIINPKTAIDIGCAKGFLVEKLRENEVEAYGIDISEYAISEVENSVKPYCKVGSILNPIDSKYDLAICIEVLEHLFEEDAKIAISNICKCSNDVIFSSTPTDIHEKTHHNVKKPSYWAKLFAENGFYRDTDSDYSFITPWAARFKKKIMSEEELLVSYEDQLWDTVQKNEKIISKKNMVIESTQKQVKEIIPKIDEIKSRSQIELRLIKEENERKSDELELIKNENENRQDKLIEVKNSLEYKIGKYSIEYLGKNFPPNSIHGRILRGFLSRIFKNRLIQEFKIEEYEYRYQFNDEIDAKLIIHQIKTFEERPKISIIMPVYNTNIEFLKNAIESVKNQYYFNWQLCICDDGSTKKEVKNILKKYSKQEKIDVIFSEDNNGISEASNKALEIVNGEYVLLLDHDDQLSKNALLEIVQVINNNRNVEFIYSDEDKIEGNNHLEPFFKPDWSPDLFFSYNYPIHVSVFNTEILKKLGGFRKEFDESQDYDLILRYLEKVNQIYHIPKVLYSWRKSKGSTALAPSEKREAFEAGKRAINEALERRKINGYCEDGVQKFTYRVRYEIKGTPLISIVIPSRNLNYLKVCLKSIFEKSTYKNFEIIILDNSQDDKIEKFSENFKVIKLIKIFSKKFNFSKINNEGVRHSKGEYIIFLNDDTQVITPQWIENMLEHAQRDEIGAVSCKLLYENNLVQHAGTIIGIQKHAGNYGMIDRDEGGYFSYAKIVRNCSAVTAACMMISRKIFDQIRGFDEMIERAWQDVDLCIRIIKSGKFIVYTPYSILYHYEGLTRGSLDSTSDELAARKKFFLKNKDFIEKGDPFYNQNLSLTIPFKLRKRWVEPLQVLYDIYEGRKDLRLNFPNDVNRKLQQMIDWAATHGIISDSHKEFLEKHYEYYFENCSEQAKPLAKKIKFFLENESVQKKFPEMYKGEYKNYLNEIDIS